MSTNSFFSNFSGTLGISRQKSRDIPPQKFGFSGFQRTYRTFWPPPLHVEDPPPHPKVSGPKSLGLGCNPDCPVQTPTRASDPKWEKNGRKMDFGPTGSFPFFGHFFSFFSVGPKSIFRTFFSYFGPEGRNRVCTGQSNRKIWVPFWAVIWGGAKRMGGGKRTRECALPKIFGPLQTSFWSALSWIFVQEKQSGDT